MQRSDFHFELPDELIAQYPPDVRGDSRLLYLDARCGEIQDRHFDDLVSLINPADLLVFNDTRVIPARLFGYKQSGGKVEILVERILEGGRLLAQIKASKTPKPDTRITLEGGEVLQLVGRQGHFFILKALGQSNLIDIVEQSGHMPLPPYIKRADTSIDRERYQNVFARQPGAVAAPTAGLHFTEAMLAQLRAKGIATGFVTLHVGAGTFQPVRSESIEDHQMHSEWFEVSAELCEVVSKTRQDGGRVIAVGTTAVRSLESATKNGTIMPQQAETNIFITPGYDFQIVDALITNFHLPESTLLMLVAAFAGRDNVLKAYAHAVEAKYRFFSYGDAMFITKDQIRNEV